MPPSERGRDIYINHFLPLRQILVASPIHLDCPSNLCVVRYCVIAAPYVRSVGHVFAYLYTLDDDLERPRDYVTSLLPKVFPIQSNLSS